jgi:hypothetical protein
VIPPPTPTSPPPPAAARPRLQPPPARAELRAATRPRRAPGRCPLALSFEALPARAPLRAAVCLFAPRLQPLSALSRPGPHSLRLSPVQRPMTYRLQPPASLAALGDTPASLAASGVHGRRSGSVWRTRTLVRQRLAHTDAGPATSGAHGRWSGNVWRTRTPFVRPWRRPGNRQRTQSANVRPNRCGQLSPAHTKHPYVLPSEHSTGQTSTGQTSTGQASENGPPPARSPPPRPLRTDRRRSSPAVAHRCLDVVETALEHSWGRGFWCFRPDPPGVRPVRKVP